MRKPTIFVFLFFLSFYLLTFGRVQEYSYTDGAVMFRVTKSIVEDFSLTSRVPGIYRSNVYISHSKYGLGFPLATVPFYLLGKYIATRFSVGHIESVTRRMPMIANVFFTALTCALLFAFSKKLLEKPASALIVTFLYGLTSIAWPYSRYDFSEPLTGLCLLYAIYSLYRYSQNKDNVSYLFLSGLALGYAFFTRPMELALIPIFCIFLRQANRINLQKIIVFLLPIIFFFGMWLVYNYIRYKSIFATGYEEDFANQRFISCFLVGLYGLLFSPGKSIFLYNPAILLIFPTITYCYKKIPHFFWFFISIFLVHLIVYSAWPGWEGGWCWGPRHLVVVLPLVFIIIGFYVDAKLLQNKKKELFLLVFSIALLGFLIQLAGIAINFNIYISETIVKKKVPFSALLFSWFYTPLVGHFYWMVYNLPVNLWDFVLFPLLENIGWFKIACVIFSLFFFIMISSCLFLLRTVKQNYLIS